MAIISDVLDFSKIEAGSWISTRRTSTFVN